MLSTTTNLAAPNHGHCLTAAHLSHADGERDATSRAGARPIFLTQTQLARLFVSRHACQLVELDVLLHHRLNVDRLNGCSSRTHGVNPLRSDSGFKLHSRRQFVWRC
jgi:hypothetical protein